MIAPPSLPACDNLDRGVTLCDIRDIGWDVFRAQGDGAVEVGVGDTLATIFTIDADGYTPPIDAQRRLDLQRDSHARLSGAWLDNRGTPPEKTYIDYMLGIRTGQGEEAPLAQFETYMIDDGAGFNTYGVTLFLGTDYGVVVLSENPGQGTSEDHFFLIEELMRGIRLPG